MKSLKGILKQIDLAEQMYSQTIAVVKRFITREVERGLETNAL